MNKNLCFLFFICCLACSPSKELDLVGSYVLQPEDEHTIAGLLELMPDSTFVISSLEQDEDYKTTSVREGTWRICKDSIIFDSGDYDNDSYGRKINFDYLGQFADSVSYLDQVNVVVRDIKFLFNEEGSIFSSKGEYVRQ